ncbi:bifunctional fucokinase/fucose-1-phosphate guanylyltransferase [Sunxiuqinia rutila]|uniref:bifunctional fucokinase/fucose-1-phosphate guanylyltransferase n=1 Tax=Sunxiuqinia rutila TaxID=1397841 RepID=UPI003D363056
MKKLLSLPENLVKQFHELEQVSSNDFFCASDPSGTKVGSGGGTAHLLHQSWLNDNTQQSLDQWLSQEQRIIIHAGGQSRRLPAYGPSGKILTPIPVFRWEQGQRLDQNLLELQLPLYEQILQKAPNSLNTLVASGDVLIRASENLTNIPEADIVCIGIWTSPEKATNHGVFFCKRHTSSDLEFMLQKPSPEAIQSHTSDHLFLMDIGIWLLSSKALKILMQRSGWNTSLDQFNNRQVSYYDLYGTFGPAMGLHPNEKDDEINKLSVKIITLPNGEFYHYGTSKELIDSTEIIQNQVVDQRNIWQRRVKPHPSMFVQNAITDIELKSDHHHLWIENSHLGHRWQLSHHHIITGIPNNNWNLKLAPENCLDMVPIHDQEVCIRPYGFFDKFNGTLAGGAQWLGTPLKNWLQLKGITLEEAELDPETDIQLAPLFPVTKQPEEKLIQWMLDPTDHSPEIKKIWLSSKRLSAADLNDQANLIRLYAQRDQYRCMNWPLLAKNYRKSVFFQVNLEAAAQDFARNNMELPAPLAEHEEAILRIKDEMFKARVTSLKNGNGQIHEQNAFNILRETIVDTVKNKPALPQLNVYEDQIIWGRSPVRFDLAGGWTDTAPFCLTHGGRVVNLAVELNGQPPLQVYVKPTSEFKIVFRSIDLGLKEEITTYEELANFAQVGSAFSIPKAALCLCGFHPDYAAIQYPSLIQQLKALGAGVELSLLAAIPKGSGLGTSSILAATVLGTLSDFLNLNWDQAEVCHRTLALEQLLTTGGGWQDQYGGILPGLKLLQTDPGIHQQPVARWLPDHLFTRPEFHNCMLLYYTGITRTAKNILAEIVRGMFLNSTTHLRILQEMKQHALNTFDTIQKGNYQLLADHVRHSWNLNQQLDAGTNPPEVQQVLSQISDYTLGHKLLGAGGGGYLFIMAKDIVAASKIKRILEENPPNQRARFVDFALSNDGFQVTRS